MSINMSKHESYRNKWLKNNTFIMLLALTLTKHILILDYFDYKKLK